MPWWRRVCKQLIFTTGIVGAAVMLRLPGAVSVAVAAPTKSNAETTTTKKATPPPSVTRSQQALSTIIFAGGLTFWGLRAAAKEDKEEEVRIREETEKLEKMTQEFTDIDGDGVIVDSDLLASLRKRMGNSTVVKGDNDPDGQGPADDSNGGGGGSATLKRPPSEPSGGTAVLEPPEESANEPTPGASKEDIDRLKRMFGSSGA
jgi:hypothetical protein